MRLNHWLWPIIVFLILLALSNTVEAKTHAYWPGERNGIGEPEYNHRIPVVDLLLRDIPPSARERWRQSRNRALRQWNRCGSVQLHLAKPRRAYDPWTITIFRDRDDVRPHGTYGGLAGDHGIVSLSHFWSRGTDVVAHELGHALGFGHTEHDDSVMGDSGRVGAVDCRGLRRYYG